MRLLTSGACVVLALLALPAAFAHDPAGTPDRFCTGPTTEHDYSFAPFVLDKTGPIIFFDPYGPVFLGDGNLEECGTTYVCDPNFSFCGDRTADFDREWEYGLLGGFLPMNHHDADLVCVDDVAMGAAAPFVVGVDGSGDGIISPSASPGLDFMTPISTGCVGVPFAAGADGGWWVKVLSGTAGHITSVLPPVQSVASVGATFQKHTASADIVAIPWGPGCSVVTGVSQAYVTCSGGLTTTCADPAVVAAASAGTVRGETSCVDSAVATATSTPGTLDVDRVEGAYAYPWTCVATFSAGATGTVTCGTA